MDGIRQQIEKVLGKSGEEGATVDGEDEMVVDDTDKDTEASRGFWAGVWDSITQSSPDHNAKSLKEANNGRLRQYAAGGTFGIYLGFEPIFKKSPDVDDGLSSNLLREGSGEYGRLVTSYTWNMYREMKGYAEADTAVWSKRVWDDTGSWFKAPTIKGIVDMAVTVVATVVTAPIGGIGGALAAAGVGLLDDAAFAALDVGGSYKQWEQAGMDFGKKTLTAAIGVGVKGVFSGYSGSMISGIDPLTGAAKNVEKIGGFFGKTTGLMGKITDTGFGGVLAKTALTGAQTMTTSLASSAVDALQWDESGFGWSSDTFASGMGGGILSSATGMTSGLVSGGMNLGLEGFTGKVYEKGSSLSDFVGGLSGQGLNYALTGDAAFNVANFSMFGLNDANKKLVSQGLLELHLGNDGMSMNLGSGGMDASVGTIAKAAAGLEAWGVNANMLFSGQDEAAKYASALRTLYSAGGAASDERNLYERILAGQTNIVETGSDEYNAWTNYNASSGTHTISLGSDAIADGSRFGMNILLAHEAYRNGIDDGAEGQEQERNRAVIGHIQAAEALGATYGLGALSGNQLAEVAALQAAYKGDASGLSGIIGRYDSSKDFWKLIQDASGNHFEWDGELSFDLSAMGIQERQASLTDEHVAAMWGYQQGAATNTFQSIEAFSSAVVSFNTVNASILGVQNLFVDKATPEISAFGTAKTSLLTSLQGIANSGLLGRVAREIADPGAGPHIFANGLARMTSNYGARVRYWPHGPDKSIDDDSTQWHNGWDVGSVGNDSYVAPFSGSFELGFSKDGGISLGTRDEDADRKVDYKHAAASSVEDFVRLFTTEGVSLNAANGRLIGIAQNMIIGQKGNTGSETTAAHGHVVYSEWRNNRWTEMSPGTLFGDDYFSGRIEAEALAISGWDQGASRTTYKLSQDNIISAYDWSRSNPELDFNKFLKSNTKNYSPEINWFTIYGYVRSQE